MTGTLIQIRDTGLAPGSRQRLHCNHACRPPQSTVHDARHIICHVQVPSSRTDGTRIKVARSHRGGQAVGRSRMKRAIALENTEVIIDVGRVLRKNLTPMKCWNCSLVI
jgi:hypothetical protein